MSWKLYFSDLALVSSLQVNFHLPYTVTSTQNNQWPCKRENKTGNYDSTYQKSLKVNVRFSIHNIHWLRTVNTAALICPLIFVLFLLYNAEY